MRFDELLQILGDAPIFDSSALRVGSVDVRAVGSQLSRWVTAGKLVSLRRGVYLVAEPYRKRSPHAFEVANILVRPSYVSLESALSFHGLIPEAVFATTSVTTARPDEFATPLGDYRFRHVRPSLFGGYRAEELSSDGRATALVATAEKALLDLAYLRPRADDPAFLRQLRLERLDRLDLDALVSMADNADSPKLTRFATAIGVLAAEQAEEYRDL